MIVLDTNVVSEVWRPQPNGAVIAWLDAQDAEALFLCTPVLAELRYGIELLESGARKERLRRLVDRLEHETYQARVLPLDSAAAVAYGQISVDRQRVGRRMQTMDALIAGVTLSRRAALATRDIGDFEGIGIDLINPFAIVAAQG